MPSQEHHQYQYRIRQSARSTVGMTRHPLAKLLAAMVMLPALQACKVQVEVPEGGRVVSESGTYLCTSSETCEIEVVDTFFKETFIAQPNPGWMFRHWEKVPSGFCGDKIGPCKLSTQGFENSDNLMSVIESDQVFFLKPVFERIPKISQDNVETAGKVVNVKDGIEVDGSVKLKTGKGPARLFEDARLEVGFDASGDLEKLDGEGLLPRDLTRKFKLDTEVEAKIGYYTGAEINADENIGITLMDQRDYLVFYAGADVSYSFDRSVPGADSKPKTESEQVTINTPAAGKVIMILDPHDEMIYRYGETPLKGAFGEAQSDQGLLPYVPKVEWHAAVDRFDGHQYKTISVGVGIKALDVFNLTGEQVTRQPKLYDIDLSDPFDSNIAYRAGFNGKAEVAISVFGFSIEDMFQFDLAEASASFEVGTKRQAMTLVSSLSPDVVWLPRWAPIKPISPLNVEMNADGKGAASIRVGGSYESLIPRAEVEGSVRITPKAVTLQGKVSGPVDLPGSITFRDNNTYGDIGITADFSEQIESGVDGAFDRAEEEVEDAIARLEEATENYEFELSLRGLRQSLPGAADAVTRALNRIPGIVYDEVYDRVKKGIDSRNKCALGVCLVSTKTRNAKARSAARYAQDTAGKKIKPYLAAMQGLKRSALEDNDETLIESIRHALRSAYAHRRYRETFKVSVKVAGFTVTKSYTVDERVLSDSQASAILTASENLHRIPETSEIKISAQQIVDQLPTREVLDRVRRELEDGVSQVPGVEAVSYTVIDGEYSAAVSFSDGTLYRIEANVFDWWELSKAITDLLAEKVVKVMK